MTYRIESDIPFPEFTGTHWATKYQFSKMREGDSILVEFGVGASAVRSAHGFAARHAGWRFTSRREAGGVRIWCVLRPPLVGEMPVRLVNKLGAW